MIACYSTNAWLRQRAQAIGFEAETFTKPFTGEPSPDPNRYLILLRHGRILSFETTMAFKPATFAQLEQLAMAAMKRF